MILVERIYQNSACSKPFLAKASNVARNKGNYCSRSCYYAGRPVPLLERFWARVRRCSHESLCIYCCWEWQGAKQQQGYGYISIKIDEEWTKILTHRSAWQVLNQRTFPQNLGGCHHCDNPPCCNPLHVYPGTQRENMQDASVRGRLLGEHHARGETNGKARLKAIDIPVIWQMRSQGNLIKEIAAHLRVSPGTIQAVLEYRTWVHISSILNAA